MDFIAQTSSNGVLERLFVQDGIPGVLWSPVGAAGARPLVLVAHGGGQDKKAPGVTARAHRLVNEGGFAVVALDAPGHGGRPRTVEDERFAAAIRERVAAGLDVGADIARWNGALASRAVPEWRAVLDELQALGLVGGAVGFWGLSLGTAIGVPLVAAEPRIRAAVLGLAGGQGLVEAAARVEVPVEFLLQWDDELVPREAGLALFDAFGSREKTLHANPGGHREVPRFETAEGFFARHLGRRGSFRAPDGTSIAYRVMGDGGEPLVCLPGGMQAGAYFGDLGGLAQRRRVVMVDLRGTGESGVPADTESYRCDRQVADVEALRQHLGVERLQLLGHSGGANLAYRYAAEFPERVAKVVLVTPSPRGLGIDVLPETRAELLERRKGEPWYAEVARAFAAIQAGRATDEDWAALAPMTYGRWDAAAREHAAAAPGQTNNEAFGIYNEGLDPERTRAGLKKVGAPVLVVAGELDWGTPPGAAAEIAAVFADARLVVLDGAAHVPWMDAPEKFTATIDEFLT